LREEGLSFPFLEVAVDGRDEILVEGLPAGEYDVSVELGAMVGALRVRGRASAVIEQKGLVEVALVLEPPAESRRVSLEGTLVVPSEWSFPMFSLYVELQDAPTAGQVVLTRLRSDELRSTDEGPDTYAWDAGLVQPGLYELTFSPVNQHVLVTVGESGATNVRFEIPPPGWVSVRVAEGTSGFPAELDELSWHPKLPSGIHGTGAEVVALDPGTAACRFRATGGQIIVRTGGPIYERTETEVDVVPERPTEVLVRARRACGILIRLLDGATPVPWGQDWEVAVIDDDDELAGRAWTVHADGHVRLVGRPGVYRLRFQSAAGFLPIPEREVHVDGRHVVDHVVELTRTP
jgi:hypothetical protein